MEIQPVETIDTSYLPCNTFADDNLDECIKKVEESYKRCLKEFNEKPYSDYWKSEYDYNLHALGYFNELKRTREEYKKLKTLIENYKDFSFEEFVNKLSDIINFKETEPYTKPYIECEVIDKTRIKKEVDGFKKILDMDIHKRVLGKD